MRTGWGSLLGFGVGLSSPTALNEIRLSRGNETGYRWLQFLKDGILIARMGHRLQVSGLAGPRVQAKHCSIDPPKMEGGGPLGRITALSV